MAINMEKEQFFMLLLCPYTGWMFGLKCCGSLEENRLKYHVLSHCEGFVG